MQIAKGCFLAGYIRSSDVGQCQNQSLDFISSKNNSTPVHFIVGRCGPDIHRELFQAFPGVFNVVEIELNVLISQCLDRRIGSMEELREEVAAWQARRVQIHAKVNWQFTTENARVKLKRLYPTFDA